MGPFPLLQIKNKHLQNKSISLINSPYFFFETNRCVKTPVLWYNTALINAMLLCLEH